jgi:AraC-like DNA-binding protein
LFRRRLDLARARLLAATDTATVTTVALECGFVNVGAFADRYRRAFGELPSQTLKSATQGSLRRTPDFPDRSQHRQDADRPELRRSQLRRP